MFLTIFNHLCTVNVAASWSSIKNIKLRQYEKTLSMTMTPPFPEERSGSMFKAFTAVQIRIRYEYNQLKHRK
jgi:hypothetical protein